MKDLFRYLLSATGDLVTLAKLQMALGAYYPEMGLLVGARCLVRLPG